MTEAGVRDLFVCCWACVPSDEVLVATEQAICKEVFIEIATQTKIDLDEARTEIFLKMITAICRLSHFHGLREGAVNNVPLSCWEHLGFVMAAYKDAAHYCYENYDKIVDFDFIKGRPKEEIKKLAEWAQERDAEIKTEVQRTGQATFDKGEFRALHELFCFVIQTILDPGVFSRYMNGVNRAFAFLRKQQALFNLQEVGNPRPS